MAHLGPSVFAAAQSTPLAFHTLASEQVQDAFRSISAEAREALQSIDATVLEDILRSDIFDVLARALGRELSGAEIGAITKCFACDTGAVVGWAEFARSLAALQQLSADPKSSSTFRAAAGASARRQKAAPHAPQEALSQPVTSAQDYGWCVGVAPSVPKIPGRDHFPSRSTDVTKGGEGSSKETYFGLFR